jgi:hypothetical protein
MRLMLKQFNDQYWHFYDQQGHRNALASSIKSSNDAPFEPIHID